MDLVVRAAEREVEVMVEEREVEVMVEEERAVEAMAEVVKAQ